MPDALACHDAILHTAITHHSGVVFRAVGDAFCAAFESAVDALAAALGAQRIPHTAMWGPTGMLQVRIALHTGVVVVAGGD
jgi:class 3 adenylate cyclase